MPINMMHENEYINCPSCSNMTFEKKDIHTLKRVPKRGEIITQPKFVITEWVCSKCGTGVNYLMK